MNKIQEFAELLEKQQIERLKKDNLACKANIINSKVTIKEGKKYTKVNIGGSGKYMVDADGNIFGIKAYGVIHKGHQFGTLDTLDQWYWGDYTAYKLKQAENKPVKQTNNKYSKFLATFKDYYSRIELELLWEHIRDFDQTLETLTDEERGR